MAPPRAAAELTIARSENRASPAVTRKAPLAPVMTVASAPLPRSSIERVMAIGEESVMVAPARAGAKSISLASEAVIRSRRLPGPESAAVVTVARCASAGPVARRRVETAAAAVRR